MAGTEALQLTFYGKRASVIFNEPVRTHSGQLGRQGAAVDAEVVRKLLAVEGNSEAARAAAADLLGEI